MRVRYSSRAEQDLLDILSESAKRFGEDAARRYAKRLVDAMRRLGTFPGLGKINLDYDDGTRTFVVGRHEIVYSIVGNEVFIAEIVSVFQDS
jgi:plasmid stabilization system protein ParE